MTRVRLDGVEKTYRRSGPHVRALAGVSLDVAPGATLAVLGPSGCGKTTLLRAVAGLEAVDAGRVRFGERDVTADPPERRRAGFVFANDALFPHRDVAANIAYGIADAAGREHGVRDCAERMRVADLLRRRPATLSAGQRQRVALARALAAAPQVLLLDEPFSRLDAPLRAELRVELGALLRDARTTTLVVTHDQSEAMALGDRVVVMRDGAVEQSGTPRDLYDRPATTFVARFVGSPAMALVPASAFGAPASADAVTLGFRPDAVRLSPDGIDATVSALEDYGDAAFAYVTGGFGALTVRVRERDAPPVPGERVRIAPDFARAHAFDAAGRRCVARG